MELVDSILTRRSIRKFKEEHIPDEQLKKILHAGMSSPSAKGGRPVEFIVVKDKEMLKSLCEGIPFWQPLKGADVCISVVANLKDASEASQTLYMLDCAAATENILLAAHAQGIGACWLGTYRRSVQEERVKTLLKLPEDVLPVTTVALGLPAEDKNSILEYKDDKVHLEVY